MSPFQSLVVSALALGLCLTLSPRAGGQTVSGPELNPFRCQGLAETLIVDRNIAQVERELEKAMDPVVLPEDPKTVRAIKLCSVAELKKRVGDADAGDYYERAIQMNPIEPGFEMFAGKYYGGARGADGPVLEMAEKHYYRALEKLEALRAQGQFRDYHAVVEDHVHKGLLQLYQKDGLPLLPWKAYPQRKSGYVAPGVSVAAQFSISRDTRETSGANDSGGFAAEAGLYVLRSHPAVTGQVLGSQPRRQELFEIARNPLRIREDVQLRLRHTYVGAVDLAYGHAKAEKAFVGGDPNFGFGNPAHKNDIEVREIGVAYERVAPLYPLFDLKIGGGVKRVHRVGVIETRPTCAQDFTVYEAKPGLSRFVSSDKLTLSGTYAFMDIPNVNCPGVDSQSYTSVRGRRIAAVELEYAFYSPLLLPALHLASLRPYRTPTRGLYLNAGYVNDDEVFGDHRSVSETFFLGLRLEGPGAYDVGLTESLYVSSGKVVDITTGLEEDNDEISGTILRSSFFLTRRLLNPDETPGVPGEWGPFAAHSLSWVFPLSFDKALAGRNDFDNFRLGTELWWQMFGTGFWGPAFLFTGGYSYQYFYQFDKHMHDVSVTLRMGWREL